MKSRSSFSRAAAGRRREWTDRSLPRHLRLSLRLGQAHQKRRPQPPIAYSQFEAADDLLLGLALLGAPGYVGSSALVVAHAAQSDYVEGSVGIAVAVAVETVAHGLARRGRYR